MFSAPAPITSEHDVAQFDCGSEALNEFLARYALLNASAGIARTFVTTLEGQAIVVGYFSLAAGSVEPAQAPPRIAKGVPRHPIPVILLARLAVDRKYQGQKLGQGLLKQALLKSVEASRIIGARAILVHAKDQKAADFYARFGFVPSPSNPFHMLLIFKDVTRILN
jgi:GNAT superfamily N-acetyltransferase